MAIRILLILLLAAAAARSAPPAVTHVFPAGGQAGATVEVTAFGTFERWPVRGWVEGKGVAVKAGKAKGTLSVTIAADATPGPRWLRLIDEHGASAPLRFLVGKVPEAQEQEPNNDDATAQVISAPAVVNGRLLAAGDVDCFAVRLRKGETFVASLDAQRSLASPMDGVLQVVSDAGFVLAQNNDYHGLDPQVTLRVPEDGRYLVRVFAFPASPDASVRFAGGPRFVYRLTLTTGGFVDHAFPLAVERAKPSAVVLKGWNLAPADRQAILDSAEGDEATVFGRQSAGTASVRLEQHPCIIHARPGDAKSPQPITLPVTVSGKLERPGEAHAFRFQGRKGQTLHFLVESAALGFAVDPVLRVTGGSPAARELPLAGDGSTFAVPADGLYQLELRDLYEAGGPRHLYRLRALVAEPDFGLTVASTQFFLTPGKTLDVPVTVDRRHGFKAAVQLSATGLPDGVRVETVADSTLRFSAGVKVTASVPIQVVGRVKEKPAVVRHARAAVQDYAATVSHLWLHVGPTSPPAPTPTKKRR